jgi:photosystem I subunit 3
VPGQLAAAARNGAPTRGSSPPASCACLPRSESAAYAKRLKNEVKGLNKRLKNYEADSAPALAIKATIERTEKRFANYAKSGLLCGNDGLPHLISDPGLALRFGHAGEVFVSGRARTHACAPGGQ